VVNGHHINDSLTEGQLHPEYHCDSGRLRESQAFAQSQADAWRGASLAARSLPMLGDKLRADAAVAFGRASHTVQDFYAHSNYVDLWFAFGRGREPVPLLSQVFGRHAGAQFSEFREFVARSGGITSGEFHVSSPGTWPTKHTTPHGHGALNKDDPTRPMHASARDAAMRATIEMHETGVALPGLEDAPVADHPFRGNEQARAQGDWK
jgi:hypothetical protein